MKKAGLIEGRKPKFHVPATVAKATASQADYIRTRAQDDEFYAKLVTDYLEKFGQTTRAEIDRLLVDKLSDALSEEQKDSKNLVFLQTDRKLSAAERKGSGTMKLKFKTQAYQSAAVQAVVACFEGQRTAPGAGSEYRGCFSAANY